MRSLIESLTAEHREVEAALERFEERAASSTLDSSALQELHKRLAGHYDREEPIFARLAGQGFPVAEKFRGQHAEALEIAAHLDDALAGQTADVSYLARRLLAIAKHNMIEEERDLFPLVPGG